MIIQINQGMDDLLPDEIDKNYIRVEEGCQTDEMKKFEMHDDVY